MYHGTSFSFDAKIPHDKTAITSGVIAGTYDILDAFGSVIPQVADQRDVPRCRIDGEPQVYGARI